MTSSLAVLYGLMGDGPVLDPSQSGGGGGNFTDETLTFTGGLITDAVREAGVEGDGLTPPAGVGIWPAATNIVTQSIPGADATTGVTLAGAAEATLTKVADAAAPFQNSSTDVWLLDNSAGGTDATVDFAGNATAAAHTGSAWARAIVGSPTVSIEGGGTPTVIAVSAAYARYSQSRTASAGDNLRITAPAGAVVRFTAGQLETGSIATPFIVTDGGTASRTAGRIQMPVAGLFTATQGAVVARVRSNYASTADPVTDPGYFTWADDNNNGFRCYYANSANTFNIRRASGGVVGSQGRLATFAEDESFSVAFAWTATTVNAAFNGSFNTPTADTNIPTLSATSADIGQDFIFTPNRISGQNFLWFATFAGTLTDADAAALNAFGDTPPTWAQIKGALPATVQLTSLWKAVDDGYERVV